MIILMMKIALLYCYLILKSLSTQLIIKLLTKLKHHGIRGPTLDLFASFLTNRYQYISLEKLQSNLKKKFLVFLKVLHWDLFFLRFVLPVMILVPVYLAHQGYQLMTPV